VVLVTSLILIIGGTFLFYIFAQRNLAGLYIPKKILISYFQSITARTAGFNTINIGELNTPSHFLLMFLMFVGGAPGSTAGGIKVITLVILIAMALTYLRREERLNIFKREVPRESFRQAFTIFIICSLGLLVFTLLLTYIEDKPLEDILFEAFSAFGTVGLSTGITPILSSSGKILISLLMLFGRVTPLCLVIILCQGPIKPLVSFSREKLYLG